MNSKKLLLLILIATSCTKVRVSDKIEPKVDYALQDRYLLQLPSPFPPLTEEEKGTSWAQEYRIGMGFAHELDLYQAITAFKRALYLHPPKQRKVELEYEILLCYYMGRKYPDVIYTFEQSSLHFVDATFPPYQDLLMILFDSYTQEKDEAKAARILEYIKLYYPESAQKLSLSTDIQMANLSQLSSWAKAPEYSYVGDLLTYYEANKKSVTKAQVANALLPGAGYLYLGQKQSAITAFLLNGLFIGASCYFFTSGNVPAGAIFTLFEAGWYFGGIYGVGEETKFYNERIYETYATPLMNQRKLFPALCLHYAF